MPFVTLRGADGHYAPWVMPMDGGGFVLLMPVRLD